MFIKFRFFLASKSSSSSHVLTFVCSFRRNNLNDQTPESCEHVKISQVQFFQFAFVWSDCFLFLLIWCVISFLIFSSLRLELALNMLIDFDKSFNMKFNYSWILCAKIAFLFILFFIICFLLFFIFACYLFMIYKFWLTSFCFNIFISVFLFKSFFLFWNKISTNRSFFRATQASRHPVASGFDLLWAIWIFQSHSDLHF